MSTPKYTFIARTFSLCSGGWVHTRLEFQITLIEIARIGRVVVRENFRRASMTEACSSARLGATAQGRWSVS